MILKYGDYSHRENGVALHTITRRHVKGPTGRRSHTVVDWVYRGVELADTLPALTAKLAALEAAYSTNNKNAILYLNDGTTETQHKLLTAGTINGVRVVGGVNYTAGWEGVWGVRTEYVYRRTYQIHLQAEYLAVESNLYAFTQTIRQMGLGGSDFEAQETLLTAPVLQTTNLQTSFMAEQFGTAIGVEYYPAFPTPMWPASLKPKMSSADMVTPQIYGLNANLLFPIVWRYRYLAGTSLFAVEPPILPF